MKKILKNWKKFLNESRNLEEARFDPTDLPPEPESVVDRYYSTKGVKDPAERKRIKNARKWYDKQTRDRRYSVGSSRLTNDPRFEEGRRYELSMHPDPEVRLGLVKNLSTPDYILIQMYENEMTLQKQALQRRKSMDPERPPMSHGEIRGSQDVMLAIAQRNPANLELSGLFNRSDIKRDLAKMRAWKSRQRSAEEKSRKNVDELDSIMERKKKRKNVNKKNNQRRNS